MKRSALILALLVSLVIAASARADVLIDTSHLSGRCIKLGVWYQSFSGGPRTITATVYRGDARIVRRRLIATTTWRTHTLTCPKPGNYSVRLTGASWHRSYRARVPTPKKTAPPKTVAPKAGPETGPLESLLVVHDEHGDKLVVFAGLFGKEGQFAPEYATPKAGEHFVSIYLSLTNYSDSTISGDADGDTTIIGANDEAYQTNFEELGGSCTNFSDGVFTLLPEAKEHGCMVYELPNGVSVQAVQFGLGLTVEAEWTA